ncbi:hypothetical protein H4R18_005428 [Coemansia javaensis]|uniref:WLM domain-containing protein n=1 Tax=Coemansia javaensis TaxID=2761396 RepID=A0A9W8H964_9FUNG|nr:hypothetical protein H4R18_005428 [Coemansia javaensis]
MADQLFGGIFALQRRPAADAALALLRRAAAQVRPIMQRRGWRVGALREFYPRAAGLLGLNVNGGAEIRLRLRAAADDARLLAFGDVLGTLLHELAHIERGPHDAAFYALLDTLTAEAEALMARGYAGDGFLTPGRALGAAAAAAAASAPPASAAARRALAARAAERRRARLGPGAGGRTLGPAPTAADARRLSPAQMAARALERRLRDEAWCGQHRPADARDDVAFYVVSDSGSDADPDGPVAGGGGVVVVEDSDDG